MKVSDEQNAPFDDEFYVESMEDPCSYLPDKTHYDRQPNCYEGLLTSLGLVSQCCCISVVCLTLGACSCLGSSSLYQLPTATAGVVEEFGKFSRLLYPGLNLINPCTETVSEVSMKAQCLRAGKQMVHTMDNVTLEVQTVVLYRVVNPLLVLYLIGADNLIQNVKELSVAATRYIIGNLTLDETMRGRQRFSRMCMENISDITRKQGILVQNILLMDITLSNETERSLLEMAREKLVSEAKLAISVAEVKSASVLKDISELLDEKKLMELRYLDMIGQVASKKDCKLIIPMGSAHLRKYLPDC